MDDVPWNPVPLIGRTTEIATLLSAIDEANGRRAGAVLLSGDAGVGKTRLLDEVATGAQQRGFTVLAGHCSDFGDAGLPYLPFTEIFGRLANDEPALVEELERTFRPITRLLPTQRLIGAEQSGADGMIDRGALFDAMLGALTRIAAKAPVLLVVEDVHWADESTRDLLGYLLTRLADQRFVVLASYRSDDLHRRHPLRRPIAEWSRLPRVRRLALAPLDTDETRALIGSLHPDPLPERDVQRILDRAGGNAFFTEELVAATSMGDPCAVPPELADLLLIRLDAVSEDAANVARVAAVAGRRVSHPLLSAVAELPDRELDAALRELIDAHVLELQGSGYGFRHALLAEAVYDDLLPGERVRLHASYAAAVRSQMVPGTAAELARHATRSHDLATAFDARVRAAEEALTVAAPQEALLHYEKAIELFPNRPPDSDVDRLWLMKAAAHAAALAAQQHRALKLLRRALSELDDDATPEDRASVLATLARIALETDEDAEAYEATTEAIKLVPEDPPSPLRARVASLHAQTSMVMGRYADATHWANHSLDVARSLGSATAVADATTTLAILRRKAGDPDAALRALTEAAEQARATGETGAEMRSRYLLGSTHYEQGRIDEAQKAFAAAWRRAQEVGRHWAAYGLDARWMLAISQFVGGDWDASLRTTQVGDEPLPATVEAVLDTARLSVRAGRGDPTALAGRRAAARLVEARADDRGRQRRADDRPVPAAQPPAGRPGRDRRHRGRRVRGLAEHLVHGPDPALRARPRGALPARRHRARVRPGAVGCPRQRARRGRPDHGREGRPRYRQARCRGAGLAGPAGSRVGPAALAGRRRPAAGRFAGRRLGTSRRGVRVRRRVRAGPFPGPAGRGTARHRPDSRRGRTGRPGRGDRPPARRQTAAGRAVRRWRPLVRTGRADRPRDRGTHAAGSGPHEPAAGPSALHQREDGQRARLQHPGQARRPQPHRSRRRSQTRQPGLTPLGLTHTHRPDLSRPRGLATTGLPLAHPKCPFSARMPRGERAL